MLKLSGKTVETAFRLPVEFIQIRPELKKNGVIANHYSFMNDILAIVLEDHGWDNQIAEWSEYLSQGQKPPKTPKPQQPFPKIPIYDTYINPKEFKLFRQFVDISLLYTIRQIRNIYQINIVKLVHDCMLYYLKTYRSDYIKYISNVNQQSNGL